MILLTGGTFDLLHFGHVLHLRHCAGIAGGFERVHVVLVADQWAKERKGELRTIITLEERLEMLVALGIAREHIYPVSKPEDVLEVVKTLEPDIYVYEYSSNSPTHDRVLEWAKGTKTILLNLGKEPVNPFGTSTTKLIERIQRG